MPKFLETKLEAGAAKKGYTGRNADAYVFGALNNMGAMHGNKETAKGAEMQKKHDAKTAARPPKARSSGYNDMGSGAQAPAAPPKKKPTMKPMHSRLAAAMSGY